MKKILVCAVLALALATTVLADNWQSSCQSACPQSVLDNIAEIEGTTNIDCCYGCWEYENPYLFGKWCGYKWEVSIFVSPLVVVETIPEPTPEPTPTVEQEMPEWYYFAFGFPCEYLNPGNQDCICFCDAPMYCP